MLPPTGLDTLHMDPVDPVPGFVDGLLLADLPPAGIDALVEAAGSGSGSPLLSLSCVTWEGRWPSPRPTMVPSLPWTPGSPRRPSASC